MSPSRGGTTAGDFIVNGGHRHTRRWDGHHGQLAGRHPQRGHGDSSGSDRTDRDQCPDHPRQRRLPHLRDSTIQESTGYAEAAILITGGTVDLGTAASPGGQYLQCQRHRRAGSQHDLQLRAGHRQHAGGQWDAAVSPSLSFTALASSSDFLGLRTVRDLDRRRPRRRFQRWHAQRRSEFPRHDHRRQSRDRPQSTNGVATLVTSALAVGSHTITADYDGNSSFAFSLSTLDPNGSTGQHDDQRYLVGEHSELRPGRDLHGQGRRQRAGSGTPTGSVDFFDTTTGRSHRAASRSPAAKPPLSTASLPRGGNTIKVTYSGDGNFLSSNASTGTITINQSIIVLDPTAGGALSLSGNASIKLTGGVYVDSSSSSAISASGNAAVKASVIDVHGGVQKSGNASFSPAPTTGAAVLADPLASLAEPSTSGLTNYGSESLSGNSSATIKPGIYSQISVSGNGTLTMNSGIYIIEGGGFSVSGNASVTGSGVMIFNAGSKYPTHGRHLRQHHA